MARRRNYKVIKPLMPKGVEHTTLTFIVELNENDGTAEVTCDSENLASWTVIPDGESFFAASSWPGDASCGMDTMPEGIGYAVQRLVETYESCAEADPMDSPDGIHGEFDPGRDQAEEWPIER